MAHYFLNSDNQPVGPMDLAAIHKLASAGFLSANVLVCEAGSEEWKPLTEMQYPETQPETPKTSKTYLPEHHPTSASLDSDKRILPAFIPCLFAGSLGFHSFYAGRMRDGLLFLAFPVAGFLGLFVLPSSFNEFMPLPLVGLVFTWVFSVGDLIRMLTRTYKDGSERRITKWI